MPIYHNPWYLFAGTGLNNIQVQEGRLVTPQTQKTSCEENENSSFVSFHTLWRATLVAVFQFSIYSNHRRSHRVHIRKQLTT